MKARLVALGWTGVVAIAAGARLAAEKLEAREHGEPAPLRSHLESQRCEAAALEIALSSDPLELHGLLCATVAGESPLEELRLLAPDDVEIEAVAVDGAAALESTPWISTLVATPRSRRTFELARRARSRAADVSVRFRLPASAPGGEPLPLACDPLSLVELGPDAELAVLDVVVPEGLSLLARGGAPHQPIELPAGKRSLGPWTGGGAPLLFGRFELRAAAEAFGPVALVAAPGELPERALEAEALARSLRATPRVAGPSRAILFRSGLAPGEVVALGGSWFAAAPTREPEELAHALLATAHLSSAPPGGDPLSAALPAALVLFAQADSSDGGASSLPDFARARSLEPGLRAWRALEAVFGERARAAAAQLHERRLGGDATELPPLLGEAAARSLLAWALAGAQARVEGWRAEMLRGRTLASGEIVLEPPPPPAAALPVELWFVGRDRLREERILVSGPRTRFEEVELLESPLLLVLDPQGALPRREVEPALLPLELEPCAFAMAPDASALAVAVTGGGARPNCGVSVLRASGEGELEVARWQPTEAPVRRLEWAVPGRHLAFADGDGRSRLLDVAHGAILDFEGDLSVAPRRGFLLESSERIAGCFSHAVHDLPRGLSWPLAVARRGPARWVAGGDDELLAAGPDGRARVLDRSGRTIFELPFLARALRVLRREPFGFVAAVDTALGGRVALFDPTGRPLRSLAVPGRVSAANYSPDTGALLVFSAEGRRDYRVTRVELEGGEGETLYRGPDRPLPHASPRRGLLLVEAGSDDAPPGAPRRLDFVSFDALVRRRAGAGEEPAALPRAGARDEPERGRRLVSAEACLDPPPVIASAGRYLYYLRARGGPRGLRGELRPRALYRYDFLAGREEPLEIASR
jgi:hypothetical protein